MCKSCTSCRSTLPLCTLLFAAGGLVVAGGFWVGARVLLISLSPPLQHTPLKAATPWSRVHTPAHTYTSCLLHPALGPCLHLLGLLNACEAVCRAMLLSAHTHQLHNACCSWARCMPRLPPKCVLPSCLLTPAAHPPAMQCALPVLPCPAGTPPAC